MERRDFLRGLGVLVGTIVVAPATALAELERAGGPAAFVGHNLTALMHEIFLDPVVDAVALAPMSKLLVNRSPPTAKKPELVGPLRTYYDRLDF